ncbi:tol-pal system protein YbgF [Puniceibacterium sediminis]|uniref:Cell division coordinator CpoB n=1 Tax=Puniceibacterium sediminis TaxID=1608407 RepID=A0A238UTF6_9RHOB|nr:tol-pal system protein YbgF [Puniceibacterium sediminis]SNR25316.1 tol-pal system protein YbgF [Puniceibacterium sediminis]
MRLTAMILAFSLTAGAVPAQQAETLADIRQDLSVLYVELQRLRTELSTTGSSGMTVGGNTIDRVNTIESALQALTSKTEEIEYRIGRVVEDGTNRIGDMEFRLCEIEPGCDVGKLGSTPRLGGGTAAVTGAAPAAPAPDTAALPSSGSGELALSEENDFRRAQEALAKSDFRGAADLFAAFRETYPGGPLEAAALLGQGKALEGNGDTRGAARAYLDAYSGYPQSEVAPESLFRLGKSLGQLGSTQEACVTLAEVASRYPGASVVADAQGQMTALGCQ